MRIDEDLLEQVCKETIKNARLKIDTELIWEIPDNPEVELNRDFFRSLKIFAESQLDNCLMLYIKDNRIQALSQLTESIKVVGICTGTITQVFHVCNQLAMTQDFFPQIANKDSWSSTFTPFDQTMLPQLVSSEDDFSLEFETTGDDSRQALMMFLAELSVKFILLHEIAHHKLEHIHETMQLNGKNFLLAVAGEQDMEIEEQGHEVDADFFAVEEIVKDFDEFVCEMKNRISVELGPSDLTFLIMWAVCIVFLNFNVLMHQKEAKGSHPLSLERVAAIFTAIYYKLFKREDVFNEFISRIEKSMAADSETYKLFHDELMENSIPMYDDNGDFTEKFFLHCLGKILYDIIEFLLDVQSVSPQIALRDQIVLLRKLGWSL